MAAARERHLRITFWVNMGQVATRAFFNTVDFSAAANRAMPSPASLAALVPISFSTYHVSFLGRPKTPPEVLARCLRAWASLTEAHDRIVLEGVSAHPALLDECPQLETLRSVRDIVFRAQSLWLQVQPCPATRHAIMHNSTADMKGLAALLGTHSCGMARVLTLLSHMHTCSAWLLSVASGASALPADHHNTPSA